MRRSVASGASSVHTACAVVVSPLTLVPVDMEPETRCVCGSIFVTESSSRFATQRPPAPAEMSLGLVPTVIACVTALRAGSMTATELGATVIDAPPLESTITAATAAAATSVPRPPATAHRESAMMALALALDGRRRDRGRRVERRVLAQDRLVARPERWPGLDAEFLDENPPRLVEHRERFGLSAAAVEREHELAAQVLAQRVAGDQRLQFGHQRRVAAELEIGVDARLQRLEAQPLEAAISSAAHASKVKSESAAPAPECESFVQARRGEREGAIGKPAPALGQQAFEDCRVDLVGVDVQSVAVLPGDDDVIGRRPGSGDQRLAYPRNVDLHRFGRPGRGLVAPDPVDEAVGGDDLACVHDEDREERTLLMRPQRDRPLIVPDLQISEDPELHVPPSFVVGAERTTGLATRRRCVGNSRRLPARCRGATAPRESRRRQAVVCNRAPEMLTRRPLMRLRSHTRRPPAPCARWQR